MEEVPGVNVTLSESTGIENGESDLIKKDLKHRLSLKNVPRKVKLKEVIVKEYLESQKNTVNENEATNLLNDSNESNDLEKILDEQYLRNLYEKFKEKTIAEDETPNNETSNTEPTMTLEEFRNANLELLLISHDSSMQSLLCTSIDLLFHKIDSSNQNFISWDDLCTYIIMRSKDDDAMHNTISLNQKPRIVKFSFLKDTIAKVIKDSNPKRLISISKDGSLDILSTDLSVLRHSNMELFESSDTQQLKRRTKIWVTDAICLSEINKLVIATANRDLQFYDLSASNINQVFVLSALPNVALCLGCYFQDIPEKNYKLFFGMDNGDIHMLTFLIPTKSLFETPFKKSDSSWRVLYSELPQQIRFVTHKLFQHEHSDWVKKVKYYSEGEILLSCSNSAKDSLMFRSINDRNRKVYIFKVTKGIECFDYNKELTLIATGGLDHIVRFWDPYVTSKPMAILKCHQTAIIDLVIATAMNQVFSYSKDGVRDRPQNSYGNLHQFSYKRSVFVHTKYPKNTSVMKMVLCIWDVKDQMCMQAISIKYPFIGHEFDHGSSPICVTTDSLLVAAENCIAEFQIIKFNSKRSFCGTHSSPVIAGLFLTNKKQIVSISEEGDKIVWDIMTGKEILSLNKYPDEEISAVCVDESGNYLVTATRNGKGRLWNLLNGINEKQLEAYNNSEITSIVILPYTRIIFMFGWARKILSYVNRTEFTTLKADKRWLLSDAHCDDILCGVFVKPDYLCTCSYDGEIILWNFERCRMVKKIQTASQGLFFRAVLRSSLGSRSSARRRQSSKRLQSSVSQSPVELLLHLNSLPYQSHATLISVEGNLITFWNTIIITKPLVQFKVFDKDDIVVTALATNSENTYLFLGSNHGLLLIYDIKGYAIVERFSQVISQALSIKINHLNHSVTIPNTNTNPPIFKRKWFAHDDEMITSISCSQGFSELFLFTSSTDCSVIMWSSYGEQIGRFGNEKECYMLSSWLQHLESKERANSIISAYESDQVESVDEEKRRSQTIDSVLGETFNVGCDRRMKDRKYRRDHFSEVDEKSVHSAGGVNHLCSPFKALATSVSLCSPLKALATSDVQEYVLPAGMPITSRMLSKQINPYNLSSLENVTTIGN